MKFLFILLFPIYLFSTQLITPIQIDNKLNHEKIKLGKMLFFDTKLSSDNSISCASCHDLANGGDDNKKYSKGVNNKLGNINTPTVLNSRFNFVQFWDGRSKTLEEQVIGPIHNPIEMNSNFKEIIQKLNEDNNYKNIFYKIYKENINEKNIINAIVEFEKSLVTPNSKFDKYLNGDETALNEKELKGYELFQSYGCISCHNGVNIGGNLFQKIGIMNIYFNEDEANLGRYNITKKEEDKFYFKVPSLRNVALTSPYLHDGSINDLKETVKIMVEYQVGTFIEEKDLDTLVDFLNTLTGELPKF
uniref:cytochrome-c peroxidase n=1 Tax=Aliarcobacter sp. TaxID=2321116 RepID=UPI00404716FC